VKKILSAVLIIIIIVSVIYLIKERKTRELAREKASIELDKEQLALQQKNDELKKRISELEEELKAEITEVDGEKMAAVFGETEKSVSTEEIKQEELIKKVNNFFEYIDRRGYLPAAGLNMKASDYCRTLFARLEKNRPVLVGETKDLYALIKNITFFFRVLGEKDVKAVKIIVEKESEVMEKTAGMFFGWICEAENEGEGMPSQEMLYDYSAFFLNTIAGQAYLFRRGSKIRLLISYYSVLVLDKADRQDLNRLGIDVRPYILSLINELENYRLFVNGKDYLENLQMLKIRYDKRDSS